MKKILVTGFEPFDGELINPSNEVIKNLKSVYGHAHIVTLLAPTAFYVSSKLIIENIHEISPDVVIMIGQAGGRKGISIERVAINIDDAEIPDNRGIKPLDNPISLFGKNALFSTLPIKEIHQRLKTIGIPSHISNTAGTYVCNHVFYSVLHELEEKSLSHIIAGFIHIPYMTEQTKFKQHMFALDINILTQAIEEIILTCLDFSL